MYNSLTLVPAYGRDYKSKKALMQDWEAGKDFLCMGYNVGQTYCSIRDVDYFKQDNVSHLHFRYQSQTKALVVKL